MWKKSIKYLGVQSNRRLLFDEHLQIATAKAIQRGAHLAQLMPNIVEPREAMRRFVVSVVHSKLLYAAPFLAKALNIYAIQKRLTLTKRGVVLKVISPFRTVSTTAVLVPVSVPLIDLFTRGRPNRLRKGSHP